MVDMIAFTSYIELISLLHIVMNLEKMPNSMELIFVNGNALNWMYVFKILKEEFICGKNYVYL